MGIEVINSQINRFLSSGEPSVLAIRGAWGVGKTHFWKEILLRQKNEKSIALNKYSYVSLFGINSLQNLKLAIFENILNQKNIGEEPSLETFKQNAWSVFDSLKRRWIRGVSSVPVLKGYSSLIDSLSFLSVKEVIVCLDDFERKGDALQPKEILGLVNLLKEQRKCKIVLILNDKSINASDSEEYRMYREKVIDVELRYDPGHAMAAAIAFPEETWCDRELKELTQKLDITNIRMMITIKRLSKELIGCLSDYEMEVQHQALHSLCLYAVAFFGHDEKIPTINDLKNLGLEMYGLGNDDEADEEKEKPWKAMLREYGYISTDEFDLVVAETVEAGYVDQDKLHREAHVLNKSVIANKSKQTLDDAWAVYHNSFNDNEEEVVESLISSAKESIMYMTPLRLDAVVRLVRDLGRDDEANALINIYIANRRGEVELFDLSGYAFERDVKDEILIKEFEIVALGKKKSKTLRQVLSGIAEKNGWGVSDERVLSEATVDDFYKIFKSENGEHLDRWISKCLRFGQFVNASETGKGIENTVKEALIRIGRENKLNALRVKKFGIKV